MSTRDSAAGGRNSQGADAPVTRGRPELGFVLRAIGWAAVLFGVLRLDWVQDVLLVPFAGFQQQIACALIGTPATLVRVDQSCTGSDAMALCVGTIFAFPTTWRKRILGGALGLALILAVNTVRIGHLSLVVGDRRLFELFHLQIWPAVLIVLTAGYVFTWMRRVPAPARAATAAAPPVAARSWRGTRFVGLTLFLVALFYLFYEPLLASTVVARAAHGAAWAAGRMMTLGGIEAAVSGGLLRTPHGAWLVTPECVLTPLIAVYLAAVGALALSPLQRLLAALAAAPLFVFLGTLRLLVLALPPALIVSHTVGIHAFYQVLVAVVAVAVVAISGQRTASGSVGGRRGSRVGGGLAVGGVVALLVGLADLRWLRPAVATSLEPLHLGHGYADPQGALLLLPAFQLGLAAALWWVAARGLAGRSLAGRLSLLLLSQIAVLVTLGELAQHTRLELPVVLIRAWSLALPLLLFAPGLPGGPRRRQAEDKFWNDVGAHFPDLAGAASTDYYLESEQRLFRELLPDLDGLRVLKTDLWDEARNTRILRWAAERGARVHGLDISLPTTRAAQRSFARRQLPVGALVSDVRAIPFPDASFDAVYSMGTIEHFDETEKAVVEIRRVLAPGGRAIIGVPNRRDPFLRPLLVALLYRLGLYAYGFEKSYSRAALRQLCAQAGLEVVAETGILFIPGWLRMLDLACHVWLRPASRLTALAVRPFAWAYRRFPGLRRHGYLIVAVGVRSAASTSSSRQESVPASKHQDRSRSTSAAAARAFEAR